MMKEGVYCFCILTNCKVHTTLPVNLLLLIECIPGIRVAIRAG